MAQRRITTQACSPEDMSYYVMIRETIHGLDNLIESTIHHSVTIIAATLSLGVTLGVAMGFLGEGPDYWGKIFLLVVTIVAFILTLNSHKRVVLYTDLLVENVAIAKKLEDILILDVNTNSDNSDSVNKSVEQQNCKDKKDKGIRLTKRIQKNVEHAGSRGKEIFKRGIIAFYAIEISMVAFLVYWLVSPCFGWKIAF